MKFYTIGYQNVRKLDKMRSILGALDNPRLIDIRYSPHGQVAGVSWDFTQLREYFGLQYLWLQEFGNMNYNRWGIQLKDQEKGLLMLEENPFLQQAVLMCCCWNYETCHRKVVAGLLRERLGCEVEEITKDYFNQQKQEALF